MAEPLLASCAVLGRLLFRASAGAAVRGGVAEDNVFIYRVRP